VLHHQDVRPAVCQEASRNPRAPDSATRSQPNWVERYSPHIPAITTVLTTFIVTRLAIFGVIALSLVTVGMDRGLPMPRNAPPLLAGLLRWDSQHYAYIAEHGYDRIRTAFFPLYPLLVKGLSLVIGNVFVAGVVLSNVALLVALGYVSALTRTIYGEAAARRAALYLAGAPAAVFFSAMYTESLFVALGAATLYHARQGHWARAACAGALAAATRNTGVILATVIALEALRQGGVSLRRQHPCWASLQAQWRRRGIVWPGFAAAAVVPGGLVAYMLYLRLAFGDPVAFVHAEAGWGKHVTLSNWLRLVPSQLNVPVTIDLLVTVAFIPLVIGAAYKMRTAAVFVVFTFVLPLGSGLGVDGMTRYTLMLVPCFVLLGSWGERKWVHRLIMGCSLPLMAYVAVLFSHWSGPV